MDNANKNIFLSEMSDSKQAQAYNKIKEDILNNAYPPGTLMVERKLCEKYDMSRSPIRNALQQLTHEGLLSFMPGNGVVVPDYTVEDVLEVYDLIETLQIYAIKSSMKKINEVSLETMHIILSNMRGAIDEKNLELSTQWDQKFHKFIISDAANSHLIPIFDQLHCQSTLFIANFLDDTLTESSYHEHMEIYENIKQENVDGAVESISKHYQNIKRYYINKLISKTNI